jgi:hypothetical protein
MPDEGGDEKNRGRICRKCKIGSQMSKNQNLVLTRFLILDGCFL